MSVFVVYLYFLKDIEYSQQCTMINGYFSITRYLMALTILIRHELE